MVGASNLAFVLTLQVAPRMGCSRDDWPNPCFGLPGKEAWRRGRTRGSATERCHVMATSRTGPVSDAGTVEFRQDQRHGNVLRLRPTWPAEAKETLEVSYPNKCTCSNPLKL